MNFGQLGLLIIKGFENIKEIVHYRNVMEQNRSLNLPPQVRPIVISASNFDILIKQGRSFDEYFRYIGQLSVENTEEQVLPTEIFGDPTNQPTQESEGDDDDSLLDMP